MKPRLLLKMIWNIPLFGWRLLLALPAAGLRSLPKRLLIFMFLFFLFAILNFLHLTGIVLDEVFFRGYRKVVVARPFFILGIPRSGTTHLQRVLANDAVFTTLQTWEAILAPSISERKFWQAIGRCFALLLRPLAHLRLPFFRKMDQIHKLGLTEAEEDFLLLLPYQQCLLLAFLGKADSAWWHDCLFHRIDIRDKQDALDWYENCLRKHLYYHGTHKRLLSKNPSFTPLLADLQARFPDGTFVACTRQPADVVPSQLSSLRPFYAVIGNGSIPPDIRDQLISLLRDYYCLIVEQQAKLEVVGMDSLKSELFATVSRLYATAGIDMNPEFAARLQQLDTESRAYESRHHYAKNDPDLESVINDVFSACWPLPPPDREAA